MSCRPGLEQRIKEIVREINSRVGDDMPSLFNMGSWKGRVISHAMKDEAFRVKLFRFIDVLPSLHNDRLVVRMLNEYFGETENVPLIIRHGTARISRKRISSLVAAAVTRAAVKSLAGQFIAGSGEKESDEIANKLRKASLSFSLDLLGEEVLSIREERQYAARYLDLLGRLASKVNSWDEIRLLDRDNTGPIPRIDISFKASSLYSQLDPVAWKSSLLNVVKGLGPLVEKAGTSGASITLDMEHYYHKGMTIAILKQMLAEHSHFAFGGIALQSYLRDTKNDLFGLIDWARENKRRVTVRLVKGAYWDYETVYNRQLGWPLPVFVSKEETDFNFETLTGMLFENIEHVRPAIATHNVRSIAHAMTVAESLGLPKEAFEFQMIYGMAEPIQNAVRSMGYRVRIYTPLGRSIPGMAYLIRRLLENTVDVSFLRKSFFELEPVERLTKAPAPKIQMHNDRGKGIFENEPLLDFSISSNRERMKDALQRVRSDFGKAYPLLISGKDMPTEAEILSRNPAMPERIVGRVSSSGREHADDALTEARSAWASWRRMAPEERAFYLFRVAEIMRGRRFELAALEVLEVGKTWKDADGDVAEAIDYLQYYGREMIRLGRPVRMGAYPGEKNEYFYEPKGVGVVISPWNFPLAIPTGMVSAAIVTGNAVIFKPSGLSPVIGWKLAEMFRSAGLPSGVLQFLPGSGGDVGEYLVSHPGIDFIAFTGSKEVGLRIVQLAGEIQPGQKNVKKVIAEMGGKNAIIVDETADLDEAVKGVLESAFGFQGQKCSACSRVIIVGGIFDEFVERLRDSAESINIGPTADPQNTMGPVVDETALKKIEGYIEIGRKEASSCYIRRAEAAGYFVGPVIFSDVNPASPIGQEEIFGPVIVIMRARDIDDAIRIANGVPYALTGGIFSRSPADIEKAKKEFIVGNLYINRRITGALVGRQPFGGFGMSGVGSKAGGPDYLLQFMNPRSISESTLRKGFAPRQ